MNVWFQSSASVLVPKNLPMSIKIVIPVKKLNLNINQSINQSIYLSILVDISRQENLHIHELLFELILIYIIFGWIYMCIKVLAWRVDPNDTKNNHILKQPYLN